MTAALALVGLLSDAEALAAALVLYGPAGLGWRQGTPADWDDARLLACGEVLYSDGRMVNRNDRRYCPGSAPAFEEAQDCNANTSVSTGGTNISPRTAYARKPANWRISSGMWRSRN